MKKENLTKKESINDLNIVREMLEFEFYDFRIKTLAKKIKTSANNLKFKTINY